MAKIHIEMWISGQHMLENCFQCHVREGLTLEEVELPIILEGEFPLEENGKNPDNPHVAEFTLHDGGIAPMTTQLFGFGDGRNFQRQLVVAENHPVGTGTNKVEKDFVDSGVNGNTYSNFCTKTHDGAIWCD